MKKLFLAGLFFLISICCHAQQNANLSAYLKSEGFVALTNTGHLPKAVLTYYPAIMKYLSESKADIKGFYILMPQLKDNALILDIPLYDIAGIKEQKHHHDNPPVLKDTLINGEKMTMAHVNSIAGNASGKDGELIIHKPTGKIIFALSQ